MWQLQSNNQLNQGYCLFNDDVGLEYGLLVVGCIIKLCDVAEPNLGEEFIPYNVAPGGYDGTPHGDWLKYGLSKGYGFVNFSSLIDQQNALLEIQGVFLNGGGGGTIYWFI